MVNNIILDGEGVIFLRIILLNYLCVDYMILKIIGDNCKI